MPNTTEPSARQPSGCLFLSLLIAALILILSQPELRQSDDERS